MNAPFRTQRRDVLGVLTESPLEVLVVGGGIVGAGVARDAAMRGLKVGLLEQHDFAFGTSSRSSRLLHGGLRYLAQGRIGLVREASHEKKIVHRIAPHVAEPLPFVFPTYRDRPAWRLWQLKLGVKVYDLLCGGRNLGRSSWLAARAVRAQVPAVRTESLTGGVRYFDGFTNDARLTLDTLRSAARHGAVLLNYCRFMDATRGDSWQCTAQDALSGETLAISARVIVNATGPWADGLSHSAVKLRLTKGIHVVVAHARVPVAEAVVMTEGRRILFAIPWGERTILGTSDTDYHGSLDHVQADEADVRYVLGVTNHFFPRASLRTQDVISVWAGLRPLVADAHGNPSDVSRSHEITNPEPGWWDVTGGKLTTYRLMAEQTVDRLLAADGELARGRTLSPCRTAVEPLLSADEHCECSGNLPPPFAPDWVRHYCEREWAVHLDDVMVRRTSWHYYLTDLMARAESVAGWMGEVLGWSTGQRRVELERYGELTHCQFSRLPDTPGQLRETQTA